VGKETVILEIFWSSWSEQDFGVSVLALDL
jgi:hypothetical protein